MESLHNSDLDDDIHRLAKLGPWIRVLVVGAFGIGAWSATLEYRMQQQDVFKREVAQEIRSIMSHSSGTFPLRDGHALDNRIARLEVQIEAIRESQIRIEKEFSSR